MLYTVTEMAERNSKDTPTNPASSRPRLLSLGPVEEETQKQRELCRVEIENGKYGGYWNDILKENLTERETALLICGICEGIMRDAMMSSSGEQFCSSCEVEDPNTSNKLLRRLRSTSKLTPSVAVRKMVNSFKCSCPLMERGCKWLGNLQDCEDHLELCGYVRGKCKLGCGTVMIRNKLNVHGKQSCPEREVSCEHCSQKLKFRQMSTHLKSCRRMEVSCELCHKTMCREYMPYHLEKDCIEKEVECPFAKYKCEVTSIKRKHLEQHLEEKEPNIWD